MNRQIVELRESVTKLTQLLAGKKLKVTQMGSGAFVTADPRTGEPKQVNIPNIPDNADQALITAIQGFIDHEVAHILFTDFTLKTPKHLDSLHNIFEDTFIERKMSELFPGSKSNLRDTGGFFIERISGPNIKKAIAAGNQQDVFAWLLVPMMRALSGQTVFQEFMDDNGYWTQPHVAELLKKLPPAILQGIKTANSSKDTLELAKFVGSIIYPPQPPAGQSSEDQGDGKGKGKKQHTKDSNQASSQDPNDGEEGEADESDQAGKSSGGKPGKEGKSGKAPKGADKKDEGKSDGDEKEDGAGDGSEDDDAEDRSDDGSGEQPGDVDGEDEDADGSKSSSNESADEGSGNDDDGTSPSGSGEDENSEENAGKSGDDDQGEGSDQSDEGENGDGENSDGAEGDESGEGDEDGDGEEDSGVDGQGGKPNDKTQKGQDDDDGAEGDDAADPSTEAAGPQKLEFGAEGSNEGQTSEDDGEVAGKGSCFSPDDHVDLSGVDLSAAISAVISSASAVAFLNSKYSVFTRDFDIIEPVKITSQYQDAWLPRLEDETRSMVGKMQKDVERMMAAQSRNIKVGMQRKGRLNAPALHRLMAGDDRVFAHKEEHRSKDTAVSLMIDNSGSMGGLKYITAMVAAYALASTLERVNIANEAIGFTTTYSYGVPQAGHDALSHARSQGISFSREIPIHLNIFKEFNDRMTPAIKQRFAFGAYAQPGRGGNVDGESIEIGAVRLLKRREKRKVMIVLSDGAPAGGNYIEIPAHLKSTVLDLQKRGIDMVGIGIMDDAVKSYYPNHVVLRNIADLPGQVMSELKKILA